MAKVTMKSTKQEIMEALQAFGRSFKRSKRGAEKERM